MCTPLLGCSTFTCASTRQGPDRPLPPPPPCVLGAPRRWPHLARACGDVLAANGAHTGSYKVVSCRQYDELALGAQVEAAAHLLVADLVDDGGLAAMALILIA